MKKLLLTSTALIALAAVGSAGAADMTPVYKAPIIAPPAVYDWTGFYVGGNVGYSWGAWDASSNQGIFNFESTAASPRLDGWLGGIQAGYNLQRTGPWVLGLEGDIQGTGEKDSQSWTDPAVALPTLPPNTCTACIQAFVPQRPGTGPAFLNSEWSLPWFSTVRGRVGFTPDAARKWMLYATGGLAFGEAEYNFTWANPGGAPGRQTYSLSTSEIMWGWVVGGGIEAALAGNWTAKLEYLYLDLGTLSVNTTDIDGGPFTVNNRVRDQIVRVGLNYRFGGPVVAKY